MLYSGNTIEVLMFLYSQPSLAIINFFEGLYHHYSTMCDVVQRTKSVHYVATVYITLEATMYIHYGIHIVLYSHIC